MTYVPAAFTCPHCKGRIHPDPEAGAVTAEAILVHAESCPSAPTRPPTTRNEMLAALGSAFRVPA